MARGEGLGNILTLFEKIQGEQRKKQERQEDRAYRSGMARWMEEARAQEGRQQAELKFMFEQMGNLEKQYTAEQERIATLGLLTTDEDTSEGMKKLISDSMTSVQKRANTLSGRMKQHSTQMERLMGVMSTQRARIGKAKETYGSYQKGFTDDALAASIYEMGKFTEGEKAGSIEALRLDKSGAEDALKKLMPDIDPITGKGAIARAMQISDKGVKQELDLRSIQAREKQVEAYRARTTQRKDDATIALRKAYLDAMKIANDTGDKKMYLKAKEAYNKLLPFSIMGGKTEDILDMPQSVIDSIIDAASGPNPEDVSFGKQSIWDPYSPKPRRKEEARLRKQHDRVTKEANKMLNRLIKAEAVSKRDLMPSEKFMQFTMERAKSTPGKDATPEEIQNIQDAVDAVFMWEDKEYFKYLDKPQKKKLME